MIDSVPTDAFASSFRRHGGFGCPELRRNRAARPGEFRRRWPERDPQRLASAHHDPKLGEDPLGRLQDADVLIDHDRIAAVGKHLPAAGAAVLDGYGKIIMPGFVDTHNHLWQTLIRGCATDQALNGWLRSCVLPLYSPSTSGPSRKAISGADGYAGAWLGTFDVISAASPR
jgi:hypothetical protein